MQMRPGYPFTSSLFPYTTHFRSVMKGPPVPDRAGSSSQTVEPRFSASTSESRAVVDRLAVTLDIRDLPDRSQSPDLAGDERPNAVRHGHRNRRQTAEATRNTGRWEVGDGLNGQQRAQPLGTLNDDLRDEPRVSEPVVGVTRIP